jgi:hypothetical protein
MVGTSSLNKRIKNFHDKIQPITESGCWIWMGAINQYGYGIVNFESKSSLAHRISYKLAGNPIPEDLCLCHSCDVRSCVNPKHLWIGDRNDNAKDMLSKNRMPKRPGEKHNMAKLTDKEAVEIYKSKEKNIALAKKYKVDPCTISAIKTGYRYSHINKMLEWLSNE